MARAIAIETSSRAGSIAAVLDGTVVAEAQFEPGLQHAAMIVPIIDGLCRAQGWSPDRIEELYVSAGPGSFTGLRIGVTLAKTLALTTGVKLVAVPTVRVLVENAPADARHVIIVLDAKREQIFTARFERDHAAWVQREPAHLGSLGEMLARAPRPVYLLGEGIPYHGNYIPKGDAAVIVTAPETWRPRAPIVAQLGAAMAQVGAFTDPDRFTPIYIRRPEAEEKHEARAKAET